jgi:hypothetical protein
VGSELVKEVIEVEAVEDKAWVEELERAKSEVGSTVGRRIGMTEEVDEEIEEPTDWVATD